MLCCEDLQSLFTRYEDLGSHKVRKHVHHTRHARARAYCTRTPHTGRVSRATFTPHRSPAPF